MRIKNFKIRTKAIRLWCMVPERAGPGGIDDDLRTTDVCVQFVPDTNSINYELLENLYHRER